MTMTKLYKALPEHYHKLAHKSGIIWIGKYPAKTNMKTKWTCHLGHIWDTAYSTISSGCGCPECARNNKRKYFEKDYIEIATRLGFRIIGEIPESTKKKTTWMCRRRHTWDATLARILHGNNCPYCASNGMKLPEDYHKIAKSIGFGWLGPKVQKVSSKTNWLCNHGHEFTTSYDSIRSNRGCPQCAPNRKKNVNDYVLLAAEKGIEMIDDIPESSLHKMAWRCGSGHVWETSFKSIRTSPGNGCPVCSGNTRKTQDDYIYAGREHGIELIGDSPHNTKEKTEWKCKKGHKFFAHYQSIVRGTGCKHCHSEKMRGPNNPNWKGGNADYGDNWIEAREIVRQRDNRLCVICHKKPNYKNHDVHHIVPARVMGNGILWKNSPENLLVLCRKHHRIAEKDYSQSIPELRKILFGKFGYDYRNKPYRMFLSQIQHPQLPHKLHFL